MREAASRAGNGCPQLGCWRASDPNGPQRGLFGRTKSTATVFANPRWLGHGRALLVLRGGSDGGHHDRRLDPLGRALASIEAAH